MIGVNVTFDYSGDFDRERVIKVAANARGMFEGMPGLRFKVDYAKPLRPRGPPVRHRRSQTCLIILTGSFA